MTYLDHAATTPVLPEVVVGVLEAMTLTGNASSLHGAGRSARSRVEQARESVAAALGAHPTEVIFTAGGTEADNMAVTGIYHARRAADPARRRVLLAPVEHHAVLEAAEHLVATEQAEITWLDVDPVGRVHPGALAEAIGSNPGDVALATVMWANNEVGTVNPIAELALVARAAGVPLHTDAVQAVGQLPVSFAASGADSLALTGHKIGGPAGAGALLLRRDRAARPVQFGGGQERGLRPGTLNVPGIVGLGIAADAAAAHRSDHAATLARLRDRLVDGVRRRVDGVSVTGDPGDSRVGDGPSRLPGNAHLRFSGCDGESLLMLLDAADISCSTGSACNAGVARPSHVLLGMGLSEPEARGALRISFGHTSTEADVEAFLAVIAEVVATARRAGRTTLRRAG